MDWEEDRMNKDLVIALAGNPNCGKTSLFNELTGSKQHVGNWPGVTVEKKEGRLKSEGRNITVVDLPGTYSLGAYSEDEVVACNFILKDKPDIVINVIDATNIERNLYLTMQLLETGANMILALNMMDEAKKNNVEIAVEKISKLLNVPVVTTVATRGEGIKELIKEAITTSDKNRNSNYKISYGKEVEREIKELSNLIAECSETFEYPSEWAALKLLENDQYINKYIEQKGINDKLNEKVQNSVEKLTETIGYEPDAFIIDKRYEAVSEVISQCVKREVIRTESTSDKIDKVVTSKWLGIPIFCIIMFAMYQFSIVFGNGYLGGMVDSMFTSLGNLLRNMLGNIGAPELITSFIVDAMIGGMGSVFIFMPMILTLYFCVSILEDSGYMARAAYVMDRFMNSVGLHGKTAVSMIIGSGCNVAGIMSTRTIESKKDRMIAILINPFVSCPARLVVYGVFVAAFFSGRKLWIFDLGGIIIFLLYALGIIVAILVGKFLSTKVFKGEESSFVMELPPYRIPTLKGTFIHMWEKSQHFLKKMGTIIITIVIIVWALSILPLGVEAGSRNSLLGMMGSFIAPLFKPAGFGDWQAGVALITGFAAKEAVVGTLGTVYGVSDGGTTLIETIRQAFTPLSALSFMVMTLLYVPCVATVGAIRRETNSRNWAITSVIYTCAIGWTAAVILYQVGRLLGFK